MIGRRLMVPLAGKLLLAVSLAGGLPSGLFPGRALLADPAGAAADIWIEAARIYPVSSSPLENGRMLIRGDRIIQIGKDLTPPPGARIIRVKGSVTPGIIDGGSTLSLRGRPMEEFFELTPAVRAADAVDLDQKGLSEALQSGVTAIGITPGDRNVIGGLGAVLATAPVPWSAALLKSDAFLEASLNDASFEENRNLRATAPFTYFHRLPTTRMGTVFLLRRALFEALDMVVPEGHLDEGQLSTLLTPAGKKVLAGSARGERPIRIRADQREEILTALRTADEFHLTIIVEGFTGGIRLIPDIAGRKIPVLLSPVAAFDREDATDGGNAAPDLARHMAEAGIRFGYASQRGSEVPLLRERVAADLRFGLSEEAALRALTLDAARILGIDDRLGSLEVGKRADLAAFSGDPFAMTSRVEWAMSGGAIWPPQAAE